MAATRKDRRPVETLVPGEEAAFARISPEPRRRLVVSAVQSFATHGYFGTTTRDIAQGAGLSPAAMYVHFDSKEAVLAAVCRLAHETALDSMLAATNDKTGVDFHDRLYSLAYELTLWHIRNQRLARVALYQFDALSSTEYKSIVPLRSATVRVIKHLLEGGVNAGEFVVPDVWSATNCILAICSDVVRWFAPQATPEQAETVARRYATLVLTMCQARKD